MKVVAKCILVADDEMSTLSPAMGYADVNTSTPLTVLVIDDEAGIREMLSYELLQEGFAVETAENGIAAVEALRQRKFDLAITDLNMPGMDGVATVEALRAADPDIEVIVATGYASVETAVACMKRGAYDYIQKPFEFMELKLLLDRAMHKTHLQWLVALYEASCALLAKVTELDLICLVLDITQRVLGVDGAAVLLWREEGELFEVHRLENQAQPTDAEIVELVQRASTRGHTQGIPLAAAIDPSLSSGDETYPSVLICPLGVKNRPLGHLALFRRQGSPAFVRSDFQKGNVFANQLALSLANARLNEELEAMLAELVATRDQLVQAEKQGLA